ncbi:acyl-CoA dehydrogenase [Nocardioides sp. Soil777]|uniref:acyl-CoA dehydrogenase n=1 Tax=Nocardioides sp. Soil777 TaxID=1736409 RepID=UPI0007033CCD|nr:acyl-CoA dehydrogenase [Nocardioides sp. Soil777]KRF01571.1 acyl-CoA dehydrogenase [Nocardioides sp. Soil777]
MAAEPRRPEQPARPVLLTEPTAAQRDELATLAGRARDAAADVPAAIALAAEAGASLPQPGSGSTAHVWSALATLGAADLTVARVLEPHLDALAILGQAGLPVAPGAWGVYAAEGPGTPLQAHSDGASWTLTGRKHWCSLAAHVDRALISAWAGEERRLFEVDLRAPGVSPVPGTWVARGLPDVDSGPVDLDAVPAGAVGEAGWYLERPGFAWGGIGVAAVWYGGAVGVARRMVSGATGGRTPDQVALMHLGAVDAALYAARCALADAAAAIDAGRLLGVEGARAALRVRQVVATAAEEVLTRAAHGLGPGPLATEEEHVRRVVDLELYVRQWHAERDQAALGGLLLDGPDPAW